MPVSYTHLRAHETVLDLVCRLLLEKKKTHLNSILLLSNYTTITIEHSVSSPTRLALIYHITI